MDGDSCSHSCIQSLAQQIEPITSGAHARIQLFMQFGLCPSYRRLNPIWFHPNSNETFVYKAGYTFNWAA